MKQEQTKLMIPMRENKKHLSGIREFLKSRSGEKWITIHPNGKGAVGKHGDTDARHVLIDDNGNIVGGSVPKGVQGKNIKGVSVKVC